MKSGSTPHFLSVFKVQSFYVSEPAHRQLSFPNSWCVKHAAALFCSTILPMSSLSLCPLFLSGHVNSSHLLHLLVGHTEWGQDGRTAANMWDTAAKAGGYLDFHAQRWQWGQQWATRRSSPTPEKMLTAEKRLPRLGLLGWCCMSSVRPSGHLQIVFTVLLRICYCCHSFCVIIPVKQWPFPGYLLKKPHSQAVHLKKTNN